MTITAPLPVIVEPGPAVAPEPVVVPGADRRRLDPMLATAVALITTTATTSGLGFLFWAVASRLYSPSRLGEDAALISAMMLLSIVAQLNLGMGIARLLPQVGQRRWRPVVAAYGVSGAVAVVVTTAFVVLAPRLSASFAFLGEHAGLGIALVAAVVLWNVFALQDAALTSARWAAVLPVENGIFGILKLALMVGLVHATHGVFLAWLVAMALMLVPVNGLLFGRVLRVGTPRERGRADTVLPVSQRRLVARYLATDYAAALLSQGYNALLPLLVLAVLGREASAYAYIAFLVAGAVAALGQAFSTSLVVEGAHDEAALPALATRSLRRYLAIVAPVVVVLIAGADVLLRLFGAGYADHASTLLRLLLAGTVPNAVIVLYLAVERVQARTTRVLGAEAALAIGVVTGAVLGMRAFGLVGVGVAWLLAHTAVAAVVAPRLWAVCRRPQAGLAGSAS